MKPGSKASVTREGEKAGGADDFEGWGKFVEICGARKRSLRSNLFQIAQSSSFRYSNVTIIVISIDIIIAINVGIIITIIMFFFIVIILVINMLSGACLGAGTLVKELGMTRNPTITDIVQLYW